MHLAREVFFFSSVSFGTGLSSIIARSGPQYITNVESTATVEDTTLVYSLESPDYGASGSSGSSQTSYTRASDGPTQSANITTTIGTSQDAAAKGTCHVTTSSRTYLSHEASTTAFASSTLNNNSISSATATMLTYSSHTVSCFSSLTAAPSSSAVLRSWSLGGTSKLTKPLIPSTMAIPQRSFTSANSNLIPSINGTNATTPPLSQNTFTVSNVAGSYYPTKSPHNVTTTEMNPTSATSIRALSTTMGCIVATTMTHSLDKSANISGTPTYYRCAETMASINTVKSAGSITSHCATGEPTPSGLTQVRGDSGHIGVPSTYGVGNWTTNKCSPVLTGNTGYSNLQMWTEADAASTWDYISNLTYDRSIDWSSFVARELNFSSWQEYQCQELSTNNNCMYQQDCTSPITPGAWMVVNSIANLWGVRSSKFFWLDLLILGSITGISSILFKQLTYR